MTKTYKVEGMTCNHCKKAVETAIQQVDGVTKAEAFPNQNLLVVEGLVNDESIRRAIENAGYLFKS